MDEQNRNMLLAAALSFVVIIAWWTIFPPQIQPPPEAPVADGTLPGATLPGAVPLPPPVAVPADQARVRAEALTRTERVAVETARLSGSISLRGGRLDDLRLRAYREALDPASATVTLLSPAGAAKPYFAVFGWLAGEAGTPVPGPDTDWRVESGGRLTETTPLTLVWDNGAGLLFRRTVTVDDHYMFTIAEAVENRGTLPVALTPYGYVLRRGEPETVGFYILHEGAIAAYDGTSKETGYDDMADFEPDRAGLRLEHNTATTSGWIGFTDKYWMAVLVPEQGRPFETYHAYSETAGVPDYRADVLLPQVTVAPGATGTATTRLFAGAKEVTTLEAYQERLGIERFDYAVDWGWFFFLTRPIFQVLHWLNAQIGNMGWSIILLTLLVKSLLFPLAWKSYVSMSRMKKLQPEMEKIKARVGDDRMKMQQEMMALYKKEKVNPAAGCLPILLQIPIFFSLYKVLFVTIEMRQAPFFGWIRDLSAPDPTSWMNLFGALPWAAPDHTSMLGILSIGVFPILMGITMWLQQKLNPSPADATQQMIFAWMPWIFMFMLGSFASGLVIYWCANNILTFTQQYTIMRTQGVNVDFFGNVKKSFVRKKKDA
jgi:YidC/Oxa1 family membrane protein insertase